MKILCWYETWNKGFYEPKTDWFDPLSPVLLFWNAWVIWMLPSTTFRKKYQCCLLYLVSDYLKSFQSQIKYKKKKFWQTAIEMGSLFLPWRSPYPPVFTGKSFIKMSCLSSVIFTWPTSTHTHTHTHTHNIKSHYCKSANVNIDLSWNSAAFIPKV